MGFPGGLDGKESTCNVGDLGSIPGLGRSSGGGHGNPLQYSCLEVHGDAKSQPQERLSTDYIAPQRMMCGVFTRLEGSASGSSRDDPSLSVAVPLVGARLGVYCPR